MLFDKQIIAKYHILDNKMKIIFTIIELRDYFYFKTSVLQVVLLCRQKYNLHNLKRIFKTSEFYYTELKKDTKNSTL